MRILLLAVLLLTVACGTVTPPIDIAPDAWISYDHKTSYFVSDAGADSVRLTVKYASFTFLDKSAELLPVAKSVFQRISNELAEKRGTVRAVYDSSKFYESVAYNGVSGVSTALVSNELTFSAKADSSGTPTSAIEPVEIVQKLEALKKALDSGLITKEEYERKKKEILERY